MTDCDKSSGIKCNMLDWYWKIIVAEYINFLLEY